MRAETAVERRVLHVLPHAGGGGETYVDALETMPAYGHDRLFLTASSARRAAQVTRGVLRAAREAASHDLVHVHGEVAAAACLPLIARRPSVVTLHGLHLLLRLTGVSRRAALLSLHTVVRTAGRTICVSEAEHRELAAAVGAVAARRAVVVRNGVELPSSLSPDRAPVRAELGLGDETVGIWVGSLDRRKDPLTAVRAASAASVTLLVVGDGPLRSDVERAAGGWVRVLGHRGDVTRLLSAADFFVLSSRREGLSFSLLEAMAAGLPAVVSDLPENVEAVGEAGIAVPVGDPEAFAAAFRRLAGHSRERLALGEDARCRVARRFSAREMIGRTREIYDDVIGRAPLRLPRSTSPLNARPG